MAKIVKRKKTKRRIRLPGFICIMFLFSMTLYLLTSLFLRSYNNNLSTMAQEINEQIAVIELQNDAVRVEINQLASSDRIDQIAAASGLNNNQHSIITIFDENGV